MNKKKRGELCYDSVMSPLGKLYPLFAKDVIKGLTLKKPSLKKASLPKELKIQFEEYFSSKRKHFDVKISCDNATSFEISVWSALKKIPYGETRTYKWLAEEIGNPKAARAVGQALKRNPIPIIIPCHRIVESDGSIGGYAPGIDIKRRLLELEYYASIG